ncbi:hypothetical protein VTO73DRAFT_14882 [Trametes versicolor]
MPYATTTNQHAMPFMRVRVAAIQPWDAVGKEFPGKPERAPRPSPAVAPLLPSTRTDDPLTPPPYTTVCSTPVSAASPPFTSVARIPRRYLARTRLLLPRQSPPGLRTFSDPASPPNNHHRVFSLFALLPVLRLPRCAPIQALPPS